MTARPLYPRGRLSAPVSGPHGEHPVHIDHQLICRLRDARAEGDEALTAAEHYDPDFSVKLSACTREADANELLEEWFERRIAVLKQTQAHFRRLWDEAQTKRTPAPLPPNPRTDQT